MAQPRDDVRYLTPEEVVERWRHRVTMRMLRRWRGAQKKGPAFVRFEGRVLYPLDFILEYEQDNSIIPKC
jgi:hypothetical protein